MIEFWMSPTGVFILKTICFLGTIVPLGITIGVYLQELDKIKRG